MNKCHHSLIHATKILESYSFDWSWITFWRNLPLPLLIVLAQISTTPRQLNSIMQHDRQSIPFNRAHKPASNRSDELTLNALTHVYIIVALSIAEKTKCKTRLYATTNAQQNGDPWPPVIWNGICNDPSFNKAVIRN